MIKRCYAGSISRIEQINPLGDVGFLVALGDAIC